MVDRQPLLESEPPEPRSLRTLRRLVNLLTFTMIFGLLTIIGLIVTTLNRTPAPLALPDNIVLPIGEKAEAITRGNTWYALVSIDSAKTERIRIFDAKSGAELQSVIVTKTTD